MIVSDTIFPEIKIITPARHRDERGFFSETFSQRDFAKADICRGFVQDNHTYTARAGTVRGLHFQIPPFAQDKLIRVLRGAIFDVAVDVRRGSPNFGRHATFRLSAAEWNQAFIPAGFAHGFCTLEPDTEVLYKVSSFYSPAHDKGLRWNDPELRIEWPLAAADALLSNKDRSLPTLAELPSYFIYEGQRPAEALSA